MRLFRAASSGACFPDNHSGSLMFVPNIQGKPCHAQYAEKGCELRKQPCVQLTPGIFISSFQPNCWASESIMWFKEEGSAGSFR